MYVSHPSVHRKDILFWDLPFMRLKQKKKDNLATISTHSCREKVKSVPMPTDNSRNSRWHSILIISNKWSWVRWRKKCRESILGRCIQREQLSRPACIPCNDRRPHFPMILMRCSTHVPISGGPLSGYRETRLALRVYWRSVPSFATTSKVTKKKNMDLEGYVGIFKPQYFEC